MTTDLTPHGPFNTLDDVAEAAAPLRAIFATVRASDKAADEMRSRRLKARDAYLANTLTGAGLELGALDERCVRWLAAVADTEELVIVVDWLKRVRAVALAELPVYGSMEAVLDALDDDEAPAPPAEPVAYKHALTPLYGRVSTVGLEARCGAAGPTVVFAADVTCPECVDLMRADGVGR